MGKATRKFSLYMTALVIHTGFNILAPFYPGIADRKGMPVWLVGLMFSLEPITGVYASVLVSKYLERIGRRNAILASLVLQSFSNFLLCPISSVTLPVLIILSVVSRVCSGVSVALGMIPTYSILTSEYSAEAQQAVACLESAMGLGLIVGPLLGSLLYINQEVVYPFLVVGCLIGAYAPIQYWVLGEDRAYVKDPEDLPQTAVFRNKVTTIQKVVLDLAIICLVPFQLEFVSTLIEVHLLQNGFSEQAAAYLYSALTLAFFLASLCVALMPPRCSKRLLMLTGLLMFVVAFLLMGPWHSLFSGRWWIAASLPLSGIASALAGGMDLHSADTAAHA